MTDPKFLSDLTVEDLMKQPCWKHFILDNIEYVLPVDKNEISETDLDNHIVLTEFFLHDKTKYFGFCSPQDTSGLDYIQPVIITLSGHLPLYFERIEDVDLPDLTNQMLSKSFDKVFPLTFVTRVKCDNKYYQRQVDNFGSLK